MDHITVRHIVEAVSGTLLCGDADTELKHTSALIPGVCAGRICLFR